MQEVPPFSLRLGRLSGLTVPSEKEATMNHQTKYPPGSPRDALVRLRRSEREIMQLLADVRSVNDNNPNFADEPLDVGRYLVRLQKVRKVITEVRAVIASGTPTLPNGILDALCEEW